MAPINRKENVKFIKLVRKRPFLFDVRDKDYKNRGKVADAWSQIAKEMGSENGILWATKWKGLRDNYKRYKKATLTESGGIYKKYKKWPWAGDMKFLDEINNYNNDDCSNEQLDQSTNDNLQDSDSEDFSCPSTSNKINSTKRKKTVTKKVDPKVMDDIDQLFQSYATSLKKMPQHMQSMLKLEIATLFGKYEIMQLQDNIAVVNSPRVNSSTQDGEEDQEEQE